VNIAPVLTFPFRIIVVNPSIKLESRLKEHWEAEDVGKAREWMLQAVHYIGMGDVIFKLWCADDFISYIYEARPDSNPTPTGTTILALGTFAASAHQLDSNCITVVIRQMWPHE
jgi:hypothetical protein